MMFQSSNDVLQTEQVEILMPPYTVYGEIALGHFRRLTDLINLTRDHIPVRHAQICDEAGQVVRAFSTVAIIREKITALTQRTASSVERFPGMYVPKAPSQIVVTTDSLEIHANIFLLDGVDISDFFLADEPRFIPLTDVRVRSLSTGGHEEAYDLLLLNRSYISLFSLAAANESVPNI